SRDGELQAAALRVQGMVVERGSSSRGGARGLAAVVRRMRRDRFDAAFAVDGPRGPYGKAKGGALMCARGVGGVLVPMASAVTAGWVARRAWDRFAVPWPFTRVVVALGAPMDASCTLEALESAISEALNTARVGASNSEGELL